MTRRIDVVLFDLDDTLHDDTLAYQSAAEEVAREVAAEHGIDALELKRGYIAAAEGFWHRLTAEQLSTRLEGVRTSLWASALQSVGLNGEAGAAMAQRAADRYNTYRKKYFTLFPGARATLERIRARGVKLGILTNGFAETHREKIALLQIGDLFDAVFIADEVGMLKPDPLLFAHACTELGSPPMYGAMVGDRYERDIRGALEAGMFSVWLNVRGETLDPALPPPHAICDHITEVAEALERA